MEQNSYIDRLRQIRHEKNLSLDYVSQKLGLSEQFIVMIELGEIVPTKKQLESIIEFVIDEV